MLHRDGSPADGVVDDPDGFLPDGGYRYYSLPERRTVTLYGKIPPEAQAAALASDLPSDFILFSYYNGERVLGTPMPFGRYVLEPVPEVSDDAEPAEAAREKTSDIAKGEKSSKPSIIFGLRPGYSWRAAHYVS
ncbi:TPA: hypothetical protein HA251_07195 [Candidatus Woesearchaeota archaeon]|nr:hypothetical protein [Candidatus Woesearchaeota archaeon]